MTTGVFSTVSDLYGVIFTMTSEGNVQYLYRTVHWRQQKKIYIYIYIYIIISYSASSAILAEDIPSPTAVFHREQQKAIHIMLSSE